jgi:hypothetical protein
MPKPVSYPPGNGGEELSKMNEDSINNPSNEVANQGNLILNHPPGYRDFLESESGDRLISSEDARHGQINDGEPTVMHEDSLKRLLYWQSRENDSTFSDPEEYEEVHGLQFDFQNTSLIPENDSNHQFEPMPDLLLQAADQYSSSIPTNLGAAGSVQLPLTKPPPSAVAVSSLPRRQLYVEEDNQELLRCIKIADHSSTIHCQSSSANLVSLATRPQLSRKRQSTEPESSYKKARAEGPAKKSRSFGRQNPRTQVKTWDNTTSSAQIADGLVVESTSYVVNTTFTPPGIVTQDLRHKENLLLKLPAGTPTLNTDTRKFSTAGAANNDASALDTHNSHGHTSFNAYAPANHIGFSKWILPRRRATLQTNLDSNVAFKQRVRQTERQQRAKQAANTAAQSKTAITATPVDLHVQEDTKIDQGKPSRVVFVATPKLNTWTSEQDEIVIVGHPHHRAENAFTFHDYPDPGEAAFLVLGQYDLNEFIEAESAGKAKKAKRKAVQEEGKDEEKPTPTPGHENRGMDKSQWPLGRIAIYEENGWEIPEYASLGNFDEFQSVATPGCVNETLLKGIPVSMEEFGCVSLSKL